MGRGVIVEHLGDAHYRIGLDIEVTYARNQLFALQTYLAEFATAYQEATEKKDAARAALTPINDRLTDYLRAGQAASQAAYDAMVAAYNAYADAVQDLPDQGAANDLLEVSNELSGEFAGNPNAETGALSQAADIQWQAFVGDFLDPAAVQAATDAKDAAISDLIVAQEQFDEGELPEEALTFFGNEYNRLYGEWVTAVQDNSGPERVAALEKAWNDATEAFNKAREDLGKLLNNGGLPEGLATILADQERAYADYHAALADWQSMTLIKAEKEKQALELQSRLIPYTDNDGNPIRQEVNAWCCDYTEDLTVGAPVATIEIPGERDLAVRVRPGYESRETYDPARDGLLQPSWAGSPEQTYWNWALHPGHARWSPTYRLGELLLIDRQAGTATVQLDQQTNNDKSKARDGTVLDVNNPIRYQIDPDTGEQTAILPGDNVIVDGGITTLTDVPIEYMECNAEIFETGDRVMVEFQGRDWTAPKVIGFAETPRPCGFRGIVFSAVGVDSRVQIKAGVETFSHIKTPFLGGNYDWTSFDQRDCLSWTGPPGRAIRPRIEPVTIAVGEPGFSASTTHGSLRNLSYIDPATYRGARYYCIDDAGPYVWRNGQPFVQAPAGQVVIGASIIRHVETDEQGNETRFVYLCLATRLDLGSASDLWDNPAAHTLSFYWARVTGADAVLPADLTLFYQIDTSPYDCLPMMGCLNFSGSGLQFAGCVPTRVMYDYTLESSPGTGRKSAGVGNDLIVIGAITPGAEGLALDAGNVSLTPQAHDPSRVGGTLFETSAPAGLYGGRLHTRFDLALNYARNQLDAAIVAVDWIAEQRVDLAATYTLAQTNTQAIYQVKNDFDGTLLAYGGANSNSFAVNLTMTDAYREREIPVWTVSASQSGAQEEPPGEPLTGNNGATHTVAINRPIFYDLRTGVYALESGTSSCSLSSTYNGGGISTFSMETEKRLVDEKSASHWETTREASETENDSGWWPAVDPIEPFSGTTAFPNGEQAGAGACHNMAMPWLQQWTVKPGGVYGTTWVETYAARGNFYGIAWDLFYLPYYPDWQTRRSILDYRINITRGITTLPLFAQPGPVTGDLVARIAAVNATPDLDDWAVHFGDKDDRNVIYASGFDIDAAWQSHLDTQHPPGEGEEPITQTALEADLKPLFRR